jgi:hypothetical protein
MFPRDNKHKIEPPTKEELEFEFENPSLGLLEVWDKSFREKQFEKMKHLYPELAERKQLPNHNEERWFISADMFQDTIVYGTKGKGHWQGAKMIPQEMIQQYQVTGQQIIKPKFAPIDFVQLYGKNVGNHMNFLHSNTERILRSRHRKNLGLHTFYAIYGILIVGTLFTRWMIINEREYVRQTTKYAYRLNDESGPKNENQMKIRQKHLEWVQTYHDDE